MKKDQTIAFLKEQIEWCQEQDRILTQIEAKLYEMKQIAELALEHELVPYEIDELNLQLAELKRDIFELEQQLNPIVH